MRRLVVSTLLAGWLASCLAPRECRSPADCLPNSRCERAPSADAGVCREEGDGGR
ncbi:MAG: hypothetical protein INH41_27900 [Myxococcaceae bacterium]|nr:hypothetical protein [Myxococcaceae bacterium]MCA3016225.1 hypothetical protein [Myxococcaceae bacterium]